MAARTRRNLKREERREQILQAALKAFGKGGYHGTHVQQIIEEAGVARGTFYLHFPSKHAVFDALVDRVLGVFLEVRPREEVEDIRSLEDAESVLRASYDVVLRTFHTHRHLVRLLFDEAVGLEKGFREKLEAHYAVWHGRVRETLALFRERGIARADLDPDLHAQMVLGMVERVARTRLFRVARPDFPGLVDALVLFELEGIRA